MIRRSEDVNYSTVRRVARPMAGVLPMALAVACAGIAVAVPVQPGVTDTPVQPGVSEPADEGRSELGTFDGPDTLDRLRPEPRPVPEYTAPAPPIVIEDLHLPEAVEPVAPIAPPPRTLRIGDFTRPVPDEVPEDLLGGVNTTAADIEAAIATQGRSVGINPSRSDKIAAATVGGALLGATVVGVPAAVAGGVVGGAAGAAVGTVIGFGVGVAGSTAATAGVAALAAAATGPGAPVVFPAVWLTESPLIIAAGAGAAGAGALIGAGVGAAGGAALAGIPAAAVGAVAGGAIGSVVGATAFQGDPNAPASPADPFEALVDDQLANMPCPALPELPVVPLPQVALPQIALPQLPDCPCKD
ncbi:hypothetical protein ACFC06_16100 [Nocardia sp. NPDC056064]|uniref:hypothetical protein n=1 Tax=Nocardia sp. NPDC056064 TaxID=3345701 RepID=UPI0035DFA918